MKTTTTLALTTALTVLASLIPPALSPAEDQEKPPVQQPQQAPSERLPLDALTLPLTLLKPQAPVVPEGTKMTEELTTAVALINSQLINPMRTYSNRRALMSRIRVQMDIEYHFAITNTKESVLPFDVYRRHRNGTWEKIASGTCLPSLKTIKLAMPETGEMVDPIKHPLFAAALTAAKRQAS